MTDLNKHRWAYWQPHLLLAIFLVAYVWPGAALANNETTAYLPNVQSLEKQLDIVTHSNKYTDDEKQTINSLLTLAISRIQNTDSLKEQKASFIETLNAAPKTLKALKKDIEAFVATPIEPAMARMPVEDLKQMLTREEIEVSTWRDQFERLEEEITAEKTLDLPRMLNEARATEETLKLYNVRNGGEDLLKDAQAYAGNALYFEQRAKVDMLHQRLLTRNVRIEIRKLEADLLKLQIEAGTARISVLRDYVLKDRQSSVAQMLKQAEEAQARTDQLPDEIRAIGAKNIALAQELATLVTKEQGIAHKKDAVLATIVLGNEIYNIFSQQLSTDRFSGSPALSTALRRQSTRLRTISMTQADASSTDENLSQARLALFTVIEQRQPTVRQDANILISKLTTELNWTDEQAHAFGIEISRQLEAQKQLLETLYSAHTQYIGELTMLRTHQLDLNNRIKTYQTLINRHLLWLPSSEPLNQTTIQQVHIAIAWLLQSKHIDLVVNNVKTHLATHVWQSIVIALLASLLIGTRRSIRRKLKLMREQIGKVHKDEMSITIKAVFFTALLAMPVPLLMAFGSTLVWSGDLFANALSLSFVWAALVYAHLSTFYHIMEPEGLARIHFQWHQSTVAILHRSLYWLTIIFVPVSTFAFFAEKLDNPIVRDTLGRFAFIFAVLTLWTFAWQTLNTRNGILRAWKDISLGRQLRYLVYPLLHLIHPTIITLSILGYHYTAMQFQYKLFLSTVVVVMGILLFYIMVRGLAITERRFALARVQARRASAASQHQGREAAWSAGEGVPDAIQSNETDLQTIGEHSRSLIKMSIIIGAGITLWQIWAAIFPAFTLLENITLWEVVRSTDGHSTTHAITLWTVIQATAISFVTFFAARNLPSTLEMVLFNRMALEQGTTYAIKTITKYFIVIGGVFIALKVLGADWSKLQWLIAALSVGLGFGLQEIVANFVSGIVILFERPIRLGDTITIGTETGTVTRIRIRATTITDWDRKELIIPNKTFITQQLTNWTLTDPITRRTLRVGVAYGTDIRLVEKTLLEVAQNNNHVLKDPPPVALFLNFGDSSLDFELRFFVRGVLDMLSTTHELCVAIDDIFRERHISISFPQRDVHLDIDKPLEVRWTNEDRENKKP